MYFNKNLLGIYKRNNLQVLKLGKILMKNNLKDEKMGFSCCEVMMKFFKVCIEKNFGRKKMG